MVTEDVGALRITRTYTCVTCGRVEEGTVVDGKQLRPMSAAGWQWWAGHGESGVEIFACSISCWQSSEMYEPHSEIQGFVKVVEAFKRAFLKAWEPVFLPILRWLDREGPEARRAGKLSWREWWIARTELSELIRGYAVSWIEEFEGIESLRWHVTFDGNKSVVIPFRMDLDSETEVMTIRELRCLEQTPWGTLGYGYNVERGMGVIFVAPEHAIDNQHAKNVSASPA